MELMLKNDTGKRMGWYRRWRMRRIQQVSLRVCAYLIKSYGFEL
jgi:hypothetical protein